jgi:hypothetical protein
MLKRALRWIGVAMASIAGLAVIAYAVVWVLAERALRRTYAAPAAAKAHRRRAG